MITRRLYRNGDSEYLINKTQCRLKDIRSICWIPGQGRRGTPSLASGQIDQILNASPQDRRELIEETAGIVRYKKQKAEALRNWTPLSRTCCAFETSSPKSKSN